MERTGHVERISPEEVWILELQSQLCKALSNPRRLMILNLLKKHGELTVTQLVEATGLPQANISQHLAFLKNQGLVKVRREGKNCYYSLSNPKLVEACELIRELILDRIRKTHSIIEKAGIEEQGA